MAIGRIKYIQSHNAEDRSYEELMIGGIFAPYIMQVKDTQGDVICITKKVSQIKLKSLRSQLRKKLDSLGITYLIIKQEKDAMYLINPIREESVNE